MNLMHPGCHRHVTNDVSCSWRNRRRVSNSKALVCRDAVDGQNVAGQPLLHHLTVFHDCNEVANLRGHPEIAGNEDDGETEALSPGCRGAPRVLRLRVVSERILDHVTDRLPYGTVKLDETHLLDGVEVGRAGVERDVRKCERIPIAF